MCNHVDRRDVSSNYAQPFVPATDALDHLLDPALQALGLRRSANELEGPLGELVLGERLRDGRQRQRHLLLLLRLRVAPAARPRPLRALS